MNTTTPSTVPLNSLDIEQVTALLTQWKLDKVMAKEFREIFVDGEALSFMEEGDFDPKNFSKAHNFHWRMFWSKLKTAKTDGVVLKTPFAGTAPAQPPAASSSSSATTIPVSHAAKFVGGYMQIDSTKHRAPRPPVHGLANVGELDLASSLAMVKTECLRLGQPYPSAFDFLGGNVYIATNFIEGHWGDLGPKYVRRGLTKQRAAYLTFYTHESPFYSVLNRLLREEDRHMLVPYKPFLKSFLSACYCLPLQPKSVKRGVKMNLKGDFEEGKEVTWWSITSTTDKVSVLQSGAFLGSKGDRTMFDISARSLVSIKEFSALPEEEFILLPGTILQVVAVLDAGNGLCIIQLKEKEPFIPFLDYIHPGLIKTSSVSTPDRSSVSAVKTASEATTPKRTEVYKPSATPERSTSPPLPPPPSASAPTHSPSSVAISTSAKPMQTRVTTSQVSSSSSPASSVAAATAASSSASASASASGNEGEIKHTDSIKTSQANRTAVVKTVSAQSMHVQLTSKERQKLDRALRGSLFVSNPKKTMQRMGLTPLDKPFGTDLTIIDFARAASLKSVPHLEAWIRADEVEKTKQKQAKATSAKKIKQAASAKKIKQAASAKKIRIKMVSLGDTCKGMTTLINHYVNDEISFIIAEFEPTIGAHFLEKDVNIEGHGDFKLEIWDTAGQERYRSLMPMYLRDAKVTLIGYDISLYSSFEIAIWWVTEARKHAPKDVVVVLVACKSDLEDWRAVPLAEAEAFAKEHGCLHVQTSAKSQLNVDKPFIDGATRWLDQHNFNT